MVTRNRVRRPDRRRPRPPADSPPGALHTALGALGKRLPEIRTELANYASLQAQRARLAVARTASRAARGLLVAVIVTAGVATATTLAVVGAADGVAEALGGHRWLANGITGVAVLAALFAFLALRERAASQRRLQALRRRYEPRTATAANTALAKPRLASPAQPNGVPTEPRA